MSEGFDERTIRAAKAFGVDPERISWREKKYPMFGTGRLFNGMFVYEPDAVVIKGLTPEELESIHKRTRGKEAWTLFIEPPEE